MLFTLDDAQLADTFSYPPEFLRVVGLGLVNLEPWSLLGGTCLVDRSNGLKERYPDRKLVPFARRQDNDDVACWDLAKGGGTVTIIHDYASPGWEQRDEFSGFNDWLRRAIEDLIAFEGHTLSNSLHQLGWKSLA